MALLFELDPHPSLPVVGGSARYPVNRIFCVGRNYEAHALEMGHAADREAPFYFTKSARALAQSGVTAPYAPGTANLHHEVELVVAISGAGFHVDVAAAEALVQGYGVGLDMTRRDLQNAAKDKGRPWSLGKDFEQAAVVGPITPADSSGPLGERAVVLTVNGETRQSGSLSELIWSVPELIADLSRYYHLVPGDLLFTGTPAGVGPVLPGDVLRGTIDGLEPVELTIGQPEPAGQ